ncbi:uncharacterized protein AMSG_11992 [Thecamonas trahens ATCC 50062]|uniref:Enoyl-CoA hydratase n=1 Tax=Thecamonas trahens ATCC 50062 TaxID=461836 RepID=A0A0L0DIT1_THETB|nr:hypothetical protein AMSG_11992 [Thecamonas trahens ATCC 50062]KNC51228.1 hypothetical protein AMSG_11992 [Thecamonas trahens ATCC 50062]|eukprot:XP_013756443.1 hypothetical protein AMSG_11992 [Thecamonas trahens ATCC 50062]
MCASSRVTGEAADDVVEMTASKENDRVAIIALNRRTVRNAVDGTTARALHAAFLAFDSDDSFDVAVLTGSGGVFCAGADLHSLSNPLVHPKTGVVTELAGVVDDPTLGPMGPTRLTLSKPVVAAVDGPAVAGGMELAAWASVRVAAWDAVFGVFCRRWGVPLIDGGSFRLPRLVGGSRAADLILTGRPLSGVEAEAIGFVNRLAPAGEPSLPTALDLASAMTRSPQACLRSDLASSRSAFDPADAAELDAIAREYELGLATMRQTRLGAVASFVDGAGRGGAPI